MLAAHPLPPGDHCISDSVCSWLSVCGIISDLATCQLRLYPLGKRARKLSSWAARSDTTFFEVLRVLQKVFYTTSNWARTSLIFVLECHQEAFPRRRLPGDCHPYLTPTIAPRCQLSTSLDGFALSCSVFDDLSGDSFPVKGAFSK